MSRQKTIADPMVVVAKTSADTVVNQAVMISGAKPRMRFGRTISGSFWNFRN
jgi:hypothetical protein